MHELKRDYTIVIVTHNMQQAARVADMTAFFSSTCPERGAPASSSSTTRPRRSSRSRATSGPRTTSRGGSDEGADPFQEELDQLEARSTRRESSCCARSAARSTRSCSRTGARRRGDRLRRRDRLALPRGRGGHPGRCSRGRRRSRAISPRALDAPRQPAPRADRRLLRDDREAREARAPTSRRTGVRRGVRGDGRARRGDDPRRARLVLAPRPRAGRDARRPRRADRPGEPALRRAGARFGRDPSSTSGACG